MSTVSGLTNGNVAAYASTTRARGVADPDGDGEGGRGHHGHRGQPPGGGGVARQLMAALQSLGVDVPAAGSNTDKGTPTATSTTAATDGGTTAGSAADGSQALTLRQDLHEFMHQLFAAAREADGGDAKGDNSGHGVGYGKGGRPGFGQGLAALISEVSGGSAPAGLQSAFDKLTADLGAGSATSGAGTGTGSDSSTSTAVTLQALLTKLQGNLGYAATGTTAGSTVSAAGNVVNSVA